MEYKSKWILFSVVLCCAMSETQCKIDKIKYFLTNYEVAEIKFLKPQYNYRTDDIEKEERCLEIKAFGIDFVMDIFQYFQREDSQVTHISKLINATGSLLDASYLIYEGHVRNVENSHVLGYLTQKGDFCGYIITDEIYVVEPYEKSSIIIYKFTDVIVPGCSKAVGEAFDCSETRYYDPWIPNKPPRPKEVKFKLLYNKNEEMLKRFQARKDSSRNNSTIKYGKKNEKNFDTKGESHHDGEIIENAKSTDQNRNNNYDGKDLDYKRDYRNGVTNVTRNMKSKIAGFSMIKAHKINDYGDGYGFDQDWNKFMAGNRVQPSDHNRKFIQDRKTEDKKDKRNCDGTKNGNLSDCDDDDDDDDEESDHSHKTQSPNQAEKVSQDQNMKDDRGRADRPKNKFYVKNICGDNNNCNYDRYGNADYLRKQELAQNSENSMPVLQRRKRYVVDYERMSNPFFQNISFHAFNEIHKESSHNSHKKVLEKKSQQRKKTRISPKSEKMEGKAIDLQCDVELVIGYSFLKKLGSNEDSIKHTMTQVMLLNKIFRSIYFERDDVPVRLTFNVRDIAVYADEVYNPFTADGSLEYFAKRHYQQQPYCMCIGFVNKYLESGQLFEGYIPKGDGGLCSKNGNHMVITHGNADTPVPMALFFSSLIRSITRALGANDDSDDCEVGTNPNPMAVLKSYIFENEIKPKTERTIFSECNVQDISRTIQNSKCLHEVFDPLCGNGIVDKGEMCDCGPDYNCNRRDPCCVMPNTALEKQLLKKAGNMQRGCTLRKGAQCGMHQECCMECKIAKDKDRCFSGHGPCDIGVCDGKSAECPKGIEYSDGEICSEFNISMPDPLICKDSKCEKGLCEMFDLKPCTCAPYTGRDCMFCCLKDGKCRAAGKELRLMSGRKFYKPNEAECIGGICVNGKCVYETRPEEELINQMKGTDFTNVTENKNITKIMRPSFPVQGSCSKTYPMMAWVFLLLLISLL